MAIQNLEYVDKLKTGTDKINSNFKFLNEKAKSAYEIWLQQPGNAGKTIEEFFVDIGAKYDAIKPDNTTFIFSDINLFNLKELTKGGYYNSTGFWTPDSMFETSNYIPVEPGQIYKFSSTTVTGHLTFWDIDGKFVTAISAGSYNQQFTVPSNTTIRYLIFPISVNEDETKLMLIKGTTIPSEYIPYKLKLSDEITLSDVQLSNYLTTDKIETTGSKNLFDYRNMIVSGKEVGTNGLIRDNVNSAMIQSLPIDATKGNLTFSGMPIYNSGNNRLFSFEDSNKQPLKTTLTGGDSIYRLYDKGTIAIPSNAKFISFNLHSNKTSAESMDYSNTQIEYGTVATIFEPYEKVIRSIAGMTFDTNSSSNKNIFIDMNLLLIGDSIFEESTMNDDGSNYVYGIRSNSWTYLTTDYKFKFVRNMARAGAAWKDRTGVEERQKASTQINAAITQNHPADIIVIGLGTNDGTTNMGDYTTAMSKNSLAELDRTNLYEALRWCLWTIQSHKPWENAIKFVSLPIQRADYEPIQSLHDAITKMAKRYGFIIIDANNESQIIREFEIWGAEGRDLYDGLHPNANGQKKLAEMYARHLINAVQTRV